MSDSDVLNEREWQQVNRLITSGKEQSLKLGKKENGLQYSYILLENSDGQKIPYRLGHEVLGQGAEGKVKVAEDQNGNKFAVKISADDKKDNAKETEIGLMKEAGATVGDVKVERDQPKYSKSLKDNIQNKRYVLLPFYAGADVDKVLQKNNLNQESKLTLALMCAESVNQLHAMNILHRDLKGANFRAKVDENGTVLSANVIDFGGAIKTGVDGKVKATPFGSPGFMSPELGREAILKAGNERVDVRKEIASLNKTLRVPEVNATKAQTLIDQEKEKLKTEKDPDEKRIIESKIKQYEVKLQEFQDRVVELKGKITIQKTKEAGLNDDLERLFTKTQVVNSKSSDVYALGKMLEKEFKLDLPALGLANMLAEKPEDRPSLSEVQKTLKENIANLQTVKVSNNVAATPTSLEAPNVTEDEIKVRAKKSISISNLARSRRKIAANSSAAISTQAASLPTWAKNWADALNKYDMGDTSARMTELLGADQNSAARKALYQSVDGKSVIGTDANKETNSARLEFIDYLGKRFAELSKQGDFKDKPTTMKELLGEEGIKLYKAACAEENNTRAFRDAVFISSSQSFDGPKWDEKLMIWVGGPSASGKSFGTEGLINQLNAKGDPNSNEKNHVVSIDGGKEREMSQMRQMVLQLGLAQGFSGVEDLEKYSKDIKAKGYVQQAVLADGTLNMVTPATFTDPGGKHEAMMEKFAKDPNTKQIFAQVRGVPSTSELDGLDQFKQTVKKMGKRRAFRLELPPVDPTKPEPTAADLVKPNNRKIGVESKDYDPEIFDFGVKQSNAMRETFAKICKKNSIPVNYFEITNDLIFVKKDSSNNWVICTGEDNFNTPGIKMTNVRSFEAFNKYKAEIPGLDIKDFMTPIYVQYKPDKAQWEELKLKKDEKPPEGAISLTKAGWEIAKLYKAHESPALDKFWALKLAEETGSKSVINQNGHPDRPKNQEDKNEEKITQVGAALRGMGVPLPARKSTVSPASLTAARNAAARAAQPIVEQPEGILRRVTGARKLPRKNADNRVSAVPDNSSVVPTNTQVTVSTDVTPVIEQKLMAELSTVLQKPNEPSFTKAVKKEVNNTAAAKIGERKKKVPPPVPPILDNAANILNSVPIPVATQAGVAALNSSSSPILPIGLNSAMHRTPPKPLPKIASLAKGIQARENKPNSLGEEALNVTVSRAVIQSGEMSRSKRSAVNFNQPVVVDTLQKEEEKLNNSKPLSGGHRNRAK